VGFDYADREAAHAAQTNYVAQVSEAPYLYPYPYP